jgi:DNA primase
MLHLSIRREIAQRYHRALPDDIRTYLKGRGIPATFIERHLLGWNGERITIPVFGRDGEILAFRYAKSPDGTGPDVRSEFGASPELYGWDTLMRKPQRVVICEGQFNRLVLEANGFPAVTSTGGAQTFLEEWLPYFEPGAEIYICFARDLAGAAAARKVQRLLPRARIVTLPPEVGEGGDATNYFVGLRMTRLDFEILLAGAMGAEDDPPNRPPTIHAFRPLHDSVRRRAERVKRAVHLHDVVATYTELRASGHELVGHCPFHDDRTPSFTVYPESDTYHCFGCEASGDVVKFLMDKESMTYGQALEALERFHYTHELDATA